MRLKLKLASAILRARKRSANPILSQSLAFAAHWAARELGAAGRAASQRNRRWRAVQRWADSYSALLARGYSPALASEFAETW